MTGKYTPLEHYLKKVSPAQKEITLTFEQIEEILNDKLPPSAHEHQAWWANESDGQHVHAHAWINSGWRVDAINQKEKWVLLVRT